MGKKLSDSELAWARTQFETDCTVTHEYLANHLGVSRQAISKHAKNWTKATDNALEVAQQLNIARPVQGSQLGKRSPENIAKLINALELCRNEKIACDVVGIDVSTLHRWKQEDPELAKIVQAARARRVVSWIEAIDRAANKDWKAANRLLQVAPETRDVFGEQHDTGPRIVLNIHRDSVDIEQKKAGD